MSAINDGGQAFPCDSREARQFSGMTLRDWFAGQAMGSGKWFYSVPEAHTTAEYCYAIADAMLAERSKQEGAQ